MNSVGSDECIFSESGGKLGLGLKKQNKTIFPFKHHASFQIHRKRHMMFEWENCFVTLKCLNKSNSYSQMMMILNDLNEHYGGTKFVRTP